MTNQPNGPVGAATEEQFERWHFSADQYQFMVEAGVFRKEDRVELLDGEIYLMAAVGPWHNAAVDVVNMALAPALNGRAIVRVQGSFRLSPSSEPEPDILVLRHQWDFYRTRLPGPEDVLLLVEVSDTSISYDRNLKLPLYSLSGVNEVWLVNRHDERVETYRRPLGWRYDEVDYKQRGEVVSLLAFPEIAIPVADLLG